jgi:hypothetical protein
LGFLVYWVKPKGVFSTDLRLPRRRKMLDEFVIFNQEFLTLIHAELPIISRWNCSWLVASPFSTVLHGGTRPECAAASVTTILAGGSQAIWKR